LTRRFAPPQALLISALALAAACAGEPTQPSQPSPPPKSFVIGPLCQEGCQDVDPYPSQPGLYLGRALTPALCEGGEWDDGDLDGLGDLCENNLSQAFAPALQYNPIGDNVGRESHWVARSYSPGMVRIMYLLSYYQDGGTNSFGCQVDVIWPGSLDCGGHPGDSEWIILDVKYNATSHHWVLFRAFYSQHTGQGTYVTPAGAAYPTDLEYLGNHLGGYPRAWVSVGKHANYKSANECGTAQFGASTCDGNSAQVRVTTGSILNLGSRAAHTAAQDCMLSTNTSYLYYGSGRIECYWTTADFRGWIPVSAGGAGADNYSGKLATWGF
jgi:hypothetical protein